MCVYLVTGYWLYGISSFLWKISCFFSLKMLLFSFEIPSTPWNQAGCRSYCVGPNSVYDNIFLKTCTILKRIQITSVPSKGGIVQYCTVQNVQDTLWNWATVQAHFLLTLMIKSRWVNLHSWHVNTCIIDKK